MVQLSNDCFAFGQPLMSLEDARRLIRDRVRPVGEVDRVPLASADGRVLAERVVARVALPPFDNAAVDGYAVRFDELQPEGESTLPVRGRVAAGSGLAAAPEGSAVRIFTGAPLPQGFDTVFMQEDVRPGSDDTVVLPSGLERGANRRPAGEDVARGAEALPAGRRLTPQAVALMAGLGFSHATVRRLPRVAVFSTGDELVGPGEALGPAQLYDANRPMLRALLARLGCEVTDLGILPDRPQRVASALREAAGKHDLLITSGGVSAGEEDHVKAAVTEAGALTFWRLAVKPGRPVAMGVIDGAAFIGLPGNPAAVFVTFVTVARALIARLAGETFEPPPAFPVRTGFAYRKKEGRREYVRARLERGPDGVPEARKHPREGAGVITSLTDTDGLIELPEPVTRVEAGETVAFLPYAVLV